MYTRKGRRSPLSIHPRMQSQATRKKTQNEDLINSISALINTTFTEFRSKMITLINKNGDQPMSLGDRDSNYEDFETNNLHTQSRKRQNRR